MATDEMSASTDTSNYTRQVNTLTKVKTYGGQSPLASASQIIMPMLDIKATVYPNDTTIVESKEP
jgi:hypothetical protein